MSAALTEIDTSELSMVDRGAVARLFAMHKRQEDMGANDVAIKVLKQDLDPELDAKFEKALEDLCKKAVAKGAAAPAMTPDVKQAVKGILQVASSFRDKLTPQHFAMLASLLGFVGDQAVNGNTDLDVDEDAGDALDADGADGGEDDEDEDDKFAADNSDEDDEDEDDTDATGKPKDGQVGKRGGKNGKGKGMSKELAAFQKAADKKHEELRKEQEKIRKENDALKSKLRKQEVLAEVAKKYPKLGKAGEVADFVLDCEAKGVSKSQTDQLLSGWNAQIQAGGLFDEKGADGEGDGSVEKSAEQKLRDIAKKLQEKNPELSDSQAFSKACTLNRGLRVEMQKRHSDIMRGLRG